MSKRAPLLYVLTLFLTASLLAAFGGAGAPGLITPTSASATSPVALPLLEGTWSGTWTDTLYAVSGDLEIVIWQQGADYFANGTIDVSNIGSALGVLSGGASGTDNGASLDITFNCTELGNGTVSLTPAKSAGGALSATADGAGNVGGILAFGPFTLTGEATDTTIDGSFDFTSPTGGKGIASLTKTSVAVESQTWGDIKATYRGQ